VITSIGLKKGMTMSFLPLLSPEEKKLVRKQIMPSFIKPMLATLTKNYFSHKDWIFERKLDGERCLLFKKGGTITLKSRNDKIISQSYPEIEEAIKKLNLPDCVLDGEIVAFNKKTTSFSLLQGRLGVKNILQGKSFPVYYYAFDILYCNGYLLTHLPLLTRKKILESLLPKDKTICYVTHKDTNGLAYLKQACKNKWEGLIAKKNDSTYISKRSSNWLKFKCSNEQELVIGGYTSPGGSRLNFGALLLGYYEKGKLHYAGKVGTGFNFAILKDLGKKLKALETKKNPFVNFDDSLEDIHWVKPQLVCEVQFTEWTKTNKLRHPSYLGLRRDKAAKEVKKEA
jgi:bifunctional non-homologous end joining protein LigD